MSGSIVQILVPRPFDTAFDYAVPEGMALPPIGTYAKVPFGRKEMWGVVWSHEPASAPPDKIKPIGYISDLLPMTEHMCELITFLAGYYIQPLGAVLSMAMSVPAAFEEPKKEKDLTPEIGAPEMHHLTDEQQAAAKQLVAAAEAQAYNASVLDGITGSGKTEVYFEAIDAALKQSKQVLVLLPEILLTTQLRSRFSRRFGFDPVIWHSSVTPAQRRDAWRGIAKGEVKLVIGARSALFLPFQPLGLIVVDEEHEAGYKQEDGVVYHARDMAVARAHKEDIPVVLVSASPSIESHINMREGKYDEVTLSSRIGDAVLPEIRTIDMRNEQLDAQHFIAQELKEAMAQRIDRGEQSLLYLNRRGYAPLTLCRNCGYRFQSPDTDSWMVLHKPKNSAPYLQCHHSDFRMPLPAKCPECDAEDSFAACGPGVERLKDEVEELFPDARVCVMASDTIATPNQAQEVIGAIESGEVDIIIGTQIVAKGHHFPKLTLVGVVDADLGLEGGDIRAAERTYQLLHQVAGRAGRAQHPGLALLQSYLPENAIMQSLIAEDRGQFVEGEIARRQRANLPPFGKLAAIILSGKNMKAVQQHAKQLAQAAPRIKHIEVYGPAPAPIALLRGNYRMRLLLKAPRHVRIQPILREWLGRVAMPSSIHCKVDVDPYSFV